MAGNRKARVGLDGNDAYVNQKSLHLDAKIPRSRVTLPRDFV
jgi:hypothetical protein